jgi:hypothetical protein
LPQHCKCGGAGVDNNSIVRVPSEGEIFSYSNALFLLPNGKYGNANEAGNYFIGFSYGIAGVTNLVAGKAQIYSLIYNQAFDEPHEQKLLMSSQLQGLLIRKEVFGKK